MSDTSYSLIKNEDGSFSYGPFLVLAPVYDRTTKKHTFNIIRNGCVPIRHDGNFLTLKNSIKRLTEGVVPVEETEPPTLGEMLGIKPDETLTADELLEVATPVFYAPDLISNEELLAIAEPVDCALVTALKSYLEASKRDLMSAEADEKYAIFKSLLDEEVETSATC